MDKTEAMILEIEKNHVLYDKADKDYKVIMRKKRHMESNWTESRTDRYVVRVRALFEWQNCSKVAFVFALERSRSCPVAYKRILMGTQGR